MPGIGVHPEISPSLYRVAVFLFVCLFYSLPTAATPPANAPEISNLEVEDWLAKQASRSTVREIIPAQYQKRYQKWRDEFLSTATGRSQWEQFALAPNFELTIIIGKELLHGAKVDFRWNDEGRLIAATMRLGPKLDSGYPSSINYPITCSLSPAGNLPSEVKGTILAATKLSHEFGHLDQVMRMDGRVYQLQNVLMLEYNRVFNSNGFNIHDPILVDLTERMGGTPVSIAQEREHWAEVGAVDYLRERLPHLNKRAKIPEPIRQAIDAYHLTYPSRLQMANSNQ